VDDGVGARDHVVQQGGVEDRALHQVDTVDVGQVLAPAGGQVVEGHHRVDAPVVDQGAAEIGADEPGPAGDHHPHRGRPHRGKGRGVGPASVAGRSLGIGDIGAAG
jgi:hypothetical protein